MGLFLAQPRRCAFHPARHIGHRHCYSRRIHPHDHFLARINYYFIGIFWIWLSAKELTNVYRFEMLLQAKNLGSRSVHIQRWKIALYVILGITLPLSLVATAVVGVGKHLEIFYPISASLKLVFTATGIATVVSMLVVISAWIAKMDPEQRKHERVRQLIRKNIIAALSAATTIFIVLPVVAIQYFNPIDLPYYVIGACLMSSNCC